MTNSTMLPHVTTASRLFDALKTPLVELGFRRRTSRIFTLDVSESTLGWLGLNTATEGYRRGAIGINPVVGVRSAEIERLVAELKRTKYHSYLPPTARTSLGHLAPSGRYREWVYDSEHEAGDANLFSLMEAIRTLAVPFMRNNAGLVDIRELLDQGLTSDHDFPYRRIVNGILLGDRDGALSTLKREVERIGSRSDAAADEARAFAAEIRSRLPSAHSKDEST